VRTVASKIEPNWNVAGRDEPPVRPVSTGIVVSTVVVSVIFATVTAIVLVRQGLGIAVLALGLLVGCCVSCARHPRRPMGPIRAFILVAMIVFALFYALALSFEVVSVLRLRRVMSFPVELTIMLAIFAMSIVLPVAILALMVRRRNRQSAKTAPDLKPELLGACIGAALAVVSVMLFAVVLLVSPRGAWQSVNLFLLALGLPIIFWPLWTFSYVRALERWHASEPIALGECLDKLREITRFEFDCVLTLRANFGNGRPCFVIPGARQSTLVISEHIVDLLSPEQLLAVLAHEAAHVLLNHGRRKLAWSVVGGSLALGLTVAGQLAIGSTLPRSFGVVRGLVVVSP
jgi:Zn-dependent protease with chaperone function